MPLYATVKKWVAELKHGRHSCEDDTQSWKPATVLTQEIVNNVHDIVTIDWRATERYIASQYKGRTTFHFDI